MDSLKLYSRYIVVYLKSQMEYRFSFVMDLFMQVFTFTIVYLNIWILLSRFNSIQGWNYYELMFIYNINFFTYGFSSLFIWEPMRSLERMIQHGTFDSILVKPIGPFKHLIYRQFNHTFLGNIILSAIVFFICLGKLDIIWNFQKVVLFMLILLGGILIQSSIMIIGGSLGFWIVKSTAIIDIFIYDMRRLINYPLSIYNLGIQIFLTFIIPYAFINFYPAHLFIVKDPEYMINPMLQYMTPVIGIIMITLACLVWKLGIGKYQSTGS